MNSDQDTALPSDSGFVVSVEITPTPAATLSPAPSPSPSVSPGGSVTSDWLAVTGFDPGWTHVAVALALVLAGATFALLHRSAMRRRSRE